MATLAVGRYQQPFLGQRRPWMESVIRRKDGGQPVLLCHAVVAVTRTAGFGNVQRVHRRPLVVLGEDGVRISVTTGAGMVGRICVYASRQLRRLARVAGVALHLRDLLRMRIILDVGVTVVALEAAVDALAETVAIHADVVARGILQPFVRVAGKAVGLRDQALTGARTINSKMKPGDQKSTTLRHLRLRGQRST